MSFSNSEIRRNLEAALSNQNDPSVEQEQQGGFEFDGLNFSISEMDRDKTPPPPPPNDDWSLNEALGLNENNDKGPVGVQQSPIPIGNALQGNVRQVRSGHGGGEQDAVPISHVASTGVQTGIGAGIGGAVGAVGGGIGMGVAIGVAKGAVLGATIGSIVPGVGTGIGAVIGAVVGAVVAGGVVGGIVGAVGGGIRGWWKNRKDSAPLQPANAQVPNPQNNAPGQQLPPDPNAPGQRLYYGHPHDNPNYVPPLKGDIDYDDDYYGTFKPDQVKADLGDGDALDGEQALQNRLDDLQTQIDAFTEKDLKSKKNREAKQQLEEMHSNLSSHMAGKDLEHATEKEFALAMKEHKASRIETGGSMLNQIPGMGDLSHKDWKAQRAFHKYRMSAPYREMLDVPGQNGQAGYRQNIGFSAHVTQDEINALHESYENAYKRQNFQGGKLGITRPEAELLGLTNEQIRGKNVNVGLASSLAGEEARIKQTLTSTAQAFANGNLGSVLQAPSTNSAREDLRAARKQSRALFLMQKAMDAGLDLDRMSPLTRRYFLQDPDDDDSGPNAALQALRQAARPNPSEVMMGGNQGQQAANQRLRRQLNAATIHTQMAIGLASAMARGDHSRHRYLAPYAGLNQAQKQQWADLLAGMQDEVADHGPQGSRNGDFAGILGQGLFDFAPRKNGNPNVDHMDLFLNEMQRDDLNGIDDNVRFGDPGSRGDVRRGNVVDQLFRGGLL